MHRFALIVAWLVVAALATGLAWGVLSSADREVGEAASTPVLGVGGTAPTTLTNDSSSPATSAEAAPTSSSTTTSRPFATSTPATVPTTSTASTTSTTSPSASTSTTTASVSWAQSTVPSPGGVVVVGHRPHEVRLESATPAPGFSMEIDKQGPDEVRVEFENDDDSFEIRVRWENGVLTTEVD